MHLLSSLVLLICLSYEVLAAPGLLRPIRKNKSFSVERVKRSNYVRDGFSALRKAYRKYGISISDMSGSDMDDFEPFFGGIGGMGRQTSSSSSESSTDTDQEGTITATSVEGGSEFVSPVVIGGQNITLDFDTGSADM